LAVKNGEFNLAKTFQNELVNRILKNNKFINQNTISKIFTLEPDILEPRLKNGQKIDLTQIKINTLDNLILTNYYAEAGQEVY
jgi:hypothetical protein